MSDIDKAQMLLEYRRLKSGPKFPWRAWVAIVGLETLLLVFCVWVYFAIHARPADRVAAIEGIRIRLTAAPAVEPSVR